MKLKLMASCFAIPFHPLALCVCCYIYFFFCLTTLTRERVMQTTKIMRMNKWWHFYNCQIYKFKLIIFLCDCAGVEMKNMAFYCCCLSHSHMSALFDFLFISNYCTATSIIHAIHLTTFETEMINVQSENYFHFH